MVEKEEEFLLEHVQQQQLSYDEALVARRNAQVMGSFDAMLGV